MDYLRVFERPELRDPLMIAAFAGWNDASEVATFAAKFLVQEWTARKMAEIEPEDFYDFTETRPTVRIAGRSQRRIEWPANEFYFHIDPNGEKDYIVLIGVEPQLKWRTFTDMLIAFAKQHKVSRLVTLGGLVADAPHTLPARLSGASNSATLAHTLRRLGVEATRYEGPTGITGVLNSYFARAGFTTASIWGSVPDYLSASPNVKVSLALLETLGELLDLELDLSDLRALEQQFDHQVNEALADNPEVQAYVHELEERLHLGPPEEEEPKEPPENLPSGRDIVQELEEYLRRRQRGKGGSQSS
ncbi:MAG: PAC2 family protein [Chloroflexi bacterium]|nr:PAC2 family protein [Chloroflexota bacterium]MCL5108089.1 PAC2 family protein [Chloroflexota bacterium]